MLRVDQVLQCTVFRVEEVELHHPLLAALTLSLGKNHRS